MTDMKEYGSAVIRLETAKSSVVLTKNKKKMILEEMEAYISKFSSNLKKCRTSNFCIKDSSIKDDTINILFSFEEEKGESSIPAYYIECYHEFQDGLAKKACSYGVPAFVHVNYVKKMEGIFFGVCTFSDYRFFGGALDVFQKTGKFEDSVIMTESAIHPILMFERGDELKVFIISEKGEFPLDELKEGVTDSESLLKVLKIVASDFDFKKNKEALKMVRAGMIMQAGSNLFLVSSPELSAFWEKGDIGFNLDVFSFSGFVDHVRFGP